MNTQTQLTDCDSCTGPGYCEKHGLWKTAHWVQLCKTRPEYRRAWGEGRGPGQASAKDASRPPQPVSAANTYRQRLWEHIRARLQDTPEHRTAVEIELVLDRCEEHSAWPCSCGGKIDNWIADVIRRDRWRAEWGPRPQEQDKPGA